MTYSLHFPSIIYRFYKFTVLALITFILSGNIFGQNEQIYFQQNSFELSIESQQKLDSIILQIKKTSSFEEIALIGYTDPDGAIDYNNYLSLQRAKKVKSYLEKNGLINPIHILSKGESIQLNSNSTEKEKLQNRRVEIQRNFSTNNKVFEDFKSTNQVFKIKPNLDTLLICKAGTSIEISNDCFQTKDLKSPITLNVKEFYSKKDFVLANLTTLDINNKLLESRGMIQIEAYQKNKKLELKPNENIKIIFRDKQQNDSTEIFNGIKHNDNIQWAKSESNSVNSVIQKSGNSSTYVNKKLTSYSEWKYEKINGELFKITKTLKNVKKKKVDTNFIFDTISAESEFYTENLLLSSGKLGWINCDRFYKEDSKKIDFSVEFKGDFTPSLVAVFKDINSVLPFSYIEDNRLFFKGVPEGMDIELIGLFKDGKSEYIQFAQKRITSRDGANEIIIFEKSTKNEIELKLQSL